MSEPNQELIRRLEHALRLARTGAIEGAALFYIYPQGNLGFHLVNVKVDKMPAVSLVLRRVSDAYQRAWFHQEVTTHDELPARAHIGLVRDDE